MHMILSAFEEKGKWQQMREGREIQSWIKSTIDKVF
jgi:hypothetical protein